MMENSFEKRIADKLKNAEVQPSEHLLDSIFEKRGAKAKRFALYPFAVALLGIAVIAVVGFWLWSAKSTVEENNSVAVLDKANSENQVQSENKTESIAKENNASEIDLTDEEIQGSKSPKRKNSLSSKSSSGVKNPEIKSSIEEKKLLNSNANNLAVDNNYFNLGKGERPLIQKVQHQGNSHLYVYETIGDEALVNRDFLFSRIARLRKFLVKKNIESIEMVENKPVKRNMPGNNKRPIYFDFMFNPSVNMMLLSGENALVDAGNAVSKTSINQGFGIRVSVPVSSQWNVFAGLNYKVQSNHYEGRLFYTKELSQINQTVKYINDPIKGVVKVVTYDTVKVQASNSQRVNFKNQYKIFQVPIGFSYNFGYKAFDFAFNGSVLFNYIKSSQGQNLNLDQHTVLPYHSSKGAFGFGASLSLMGAYKINNRIRLIAEPGIQYFGLRSSHFGNNLSEKVLSPQLTIGLRYTLF